MVLILLIASVFLQPLVPVVHLPILVLVWYAAKTETVEKAYIIAVGLGLLGDLVFGNRLGVLAVAYLLAVFCVALFRLRFKFNFWLLVIFLIISQIVYYYARGFVG